MLLELVKFYLHARRYVFIIYYFYIYNDSQLENYLYIFMALHTHLNSVSLPPSGCIVVDGINGSVAAGRSTPRDEAAILALEQFMRPPVDR